MINQVRALAANDEQSLSLEIVFGEADKEAAGKEYEESVVAAKVKSEEQADVTPPEAKMPRMKPQRKNHKNQ